MAEDLQHIRSRSLKSVVSLLAQSSYAAALGFAAFFILTLKSGVYLLGIYNTVLAMLSTFNYATNLGLAAAIMQKEKVTQTDLNTAFYMQFGLSTLAVVVGFLLTPFVFRAYPDLPAHAIYLYYAMLFSFFVLTFRTIPSVLLEKDIEIYKVVTAQAIENTVFYVTVIVMVLMGYEIESLVVAVCLRAFIGAGVILFMRPWLPGFSFSMSSAKSLLAYGIPFQGNSFLALIKDDLLILYLGSAIGLRNLGYVTFGKKYAEFAIRLIMDNVNRVSFPVLSRFQSSPDLLSKTLKKIYFYESALIFPAVIGGIVVFDSLLHVMPGEYFAKWQPALFSFYFFSLSSLLVSLYSPLISFFNAVGRVKTTLALMVFFTALSWGLILLAMNLFGYNGISIAFFIHSFSFILVVHLAQKQLKFSLFEYIKPAIMSSVAMLLLLITIRIMSITFLQSMLFHLILSIILGGGIYFVALYFSAKQFIKDELHKFNRFQPILKFLHLL